MTPIAQIAGDLQIYGNTKINSSSFSIVPDNNLAYRGSYYSHVNDEFYLQSVMYSGSDYKSISRNSSNSNPNGYDVEKENRGNNDTLIEDLRLSLKIRKGFQAFHLTDYLPQLLLTPS